MAVTVGVFYNSTCQTTNKLTGQPIPEEKRQHSHHAWHDDGRGGPTPAAARIHPGVSGTDRHDKTPTGNGMTGDKNKPIVF
jgi:hypothetical protein